MSFELYRGTLDEDLRPLSAVLWQQQLPHRIVEDGGDQVLQLQRNEDLPKAQEVLRRWQRGDLKVAVRYHRAAPLQLRLLPLFAQVPVTLILISVSTVGFLLIYAGAPVSWVSWLSYEPFTLVNGRPAFGDGSGQLWRLITPVFIHFGWMHIVFNSLWCWELGKRIEATLGSLNMAGLFLVTAILSNTAQHQVSGPVLFGGLSGVVYGLLGFAWVAGRVNPAWRQLAPATPIMLFMVGWLVICLLGVVDVLGFSVANAAHVGGLGSGALIGLVFALAYRRSV